MANSEGRAPLPLRETKHQHLSVSVGFPGLKRCQMPSEDNPGPPIGRHKSNLRALSFHGVRMPKDTRCSISPLEFGMRRGDTSAHGLMYRVDLREKGEGKGDQKFTLAHHRYHQWSCRAIEHGIASVSGSPSRQCTCALQIRLE